MKINIVKLLRVAGQLVLAAPTIIDIIRPALAKRTRPEQRPGEEAPAPPSPLTERPDATFINAPPA